MFTLNVKRLEATVSISISYGDGYGNSLSKNIILIIDENEFRYNVPIKKGINYITIEAVINGKNVCVSKMLTYDEIIVDFDDFIEEVDGVIKANSEIFSIIK